MHTKAIEILGLKIGILSNKKELLPVFPLKIELKSLLTDFHEIKEIEYNQDLDAYFIILDEEKLKPRIFITQSRIFAHGPFVRLTRECEDLRYSFFGNEGLFFRFVLFLLEEKRDIYSFHACSLYDEKLKEFYIICGSAGSGKTCLLLRGLELGLKLFSAEMTHFKIDKNEIKFFKGALVDNIRIGNLKYNFPEIIKSLSLKLPDAEDEWGKKIAINLSKYETSFNELINPKITIIFPRIEENRERIDLTDITNRKKTIIKLLFDYATEKIGEEFLIYESIPVKFIDTFEAGLRRIEKIKNFIEKGKIKRVLKIFAGARNCWEGIIN
ncbi:hypothetical protein NLC82_03005 [Candidatus Aminicenantes bacterium AC-335-A11]|jgi:hypothetical protein|nr:hypothetical protein [SCandidatus Aminicenantes bacterium Aminicenantia_JdfR_composite]MCP2596626.1 hypothetical protein [Candidatus Aminicenantes bacterium AC-335-G13]MCP2598048.1 hypothetical protein [Candidatus Aminicenantes bacterium AC-335-L06]MCP2618368.1 hypothetical protein [Candidatus Aminicenantes bacterium AC-335-A11]